MTNPTPQTLPELPELPEPDTTWYGSFSSDPVKFHSTDQIYEFAAARVKAALAAQPPAVAAIPEDPLDSPLPCDVTVGHGTMRKGVPLRSLVLRMKTLYEMATGNNADEVAGRSISERSALFEKSPFNLMNYEVGGRFKPTLSPEAQALSVQLGLKSPQPPAGQQDSGEAPTDAEVDMLLAEIDQIARDHDGEHYGLPTWEADRVQSMRAQVLWFFGRWTATAPSPAAPGNEEGKS